MDVALLAVIAGVLGAGIAGALVTTWGFHRRAFRLECRVQDLEERLLTVKNREKVGKRWIKQEQEESELANFMKQPIAAVPRERFANDPLEDRG